jgi:hypothetical protein
MTWLINGFPHLGMTIHVKSSKMERDAQNGNEKRSGAVPYTAR